jgi:hypothetical protein
MSDLLSNQMLLSGRVKKTPPALVSESRYEWIKLQEVEPDLGVPAVDGSLLYSTLAGVRAWTDSISIDTTGNLILESEIRLGDPESDNYSRLRHASGVSSAYGFTGFDNQYTVLINEEASVAQALFLSDVDSGSTGTIFGISVLNGSTDLPSTGAEAWIPRLTLTGVGKLITSNSVDIQTGDLELQSGDIYRNKFNISVISRTGTEITCKLSLLLQNYLRMDSLTFRENTGIVYSRNNETIKLLIP